MEFPEMCALCHSPATGFATIGDERYCHGDYDDEPTCYERASWDGAGAARLLEAIFMDPDEFEVTYRDHTD